ncbi:MAG: proliferating cell nuclear antigen (pcna) [Thermoplasmata archaeon]|nr:proliferating cell nuclear antigen (pcna) [Thermoplasmata archaeon]TFG71088.1 MAG: proliferating cell nuclear antigen (pcna) [Methanomassiliicoccus sp.]
MFQAKARAEVLKEVVNVVSSLVDEAKFSVNADGLTLRAVDPAHIAMVDLSLGKDAFEEFKADETEIGIDIDKLAQFLKLAKSDDIVDLKHDEDKRRLIIVVGDITRRMSLIDTTGMSDPKVPNLKLDAIITIKGEDLIHGIRASETVSDHIALIANPDGFEMSCEGDMDQVHFRKSKKDLVSLESPSSVRSLFPLEYFSNMLKAVSSGTHVVLHLGNDFPVKMEFTIAGGKGAVRYLLAPRIESGD